MIDVSNDPSQKDLPEEMLPPWQRKKRNGPPLLVLSVVTLVGGLIVLNVGWITGSSVLIYASLAASALALVLLLMAVVRGSKDSGGE